MKRAPSELAHAKAMLCLEHAARDDFSSAIDVIATLDQRELFVAVLTWMDSALHAQGITEYGEQNRSVPTTLVDTHVGVIASGDAPVEVRDAVAMLHARMCADRDAFERVTRNGHNRWPTTCLTLLHICASSIEATRERKPLQQ